MMKFEDNIAVLVEGMIETLGLEAKGHQKLRELEGRRGVGKRERIEVMLEVALEVLEKRGGVGVSEDGQALDEIKALRRDFNGLVDRLENLKIKVPKSVVADTDSAGLAREVAAIKNMLGELTAAKTEAVTIKRLWWAVSILVVIIAMLSLWLF